MGMLFGNFDKEISKFGNSCKKTHFFNFGPENAKMWQVLSRKCQLKALLMEKLV